MFDKYVWLIVLCGSGVASCLTYIVCLLCHEKRQQNKVGKRSRHEETLVINLDD